MKSFLLSRLAHMTVAWFQKIALPVHCPSAILERKSQFNLGLLTQPQIVLARLCTVSTHPWGSSPMNYATSIIFKCVYFLKCQLALVKQILHQLHP